MSSEMFHFTKNVDLSNFTLVIPTVSVGNVPQLTIDLLISSLNFEKTATIWHPAIVSSVGADPYDFTNNDICTACELYTNPSLKLALIQLRSTLEFEQASKLFRDLKEALLGFKLQQIIILTSGFDYELQIISNHKFYFISNNEEAGIVLKALNVKPIAVGLDDRYAVHGSGFAVKLFEILNDSIDCTVLIKYVSEGDNRPDAITTMETLSKFIENLKTVDLNTLIKFPCSWNFVFGGPPPVGIY